MKKRTLKRESIVNTQIFNKYKEELAKEHDFSELDKSIKQLESDKEQTNLGRS